MSQDPGTDQDLNTYNIQCVSCVSCIQVPLWLPEQVFDFLKTLYDEHDISMELQISFLNSVRAHLEEFSEFSSVAASLSNNTKKIINNLLDM